MQRICNPVSSFSPVSYDLKASKRASGCMEGLEGLSVVVVDVVASSVVVELDGTSVLVVVVVISGEVVLTNASVVVL